MKPRVPSHMRIAQLDAAEVAGEVIAKAELLAAEGAMTLLCLLKLTHCAIRYAYGYYYPYGKILQGRGNS